MFLVLFSCNNGSTKKTSSDVAANSPITTLYHGGDIITMEGVEGSTAEAVVTEGAQIKFVGDLTAAREKFAGAQDVDLKGKTIMPGFIEQHLHPFLGALTLAVPVIAPEPWELPGKTWPAAKDHADYMAKLKAAFAEHKDSSKTFYTWGYHQYFHGPISRKDLDAISQATPIAVWHRSAHEFFVNSAYLKKFGFTPEDLKKQPKEIQKQVNLENGHIFESGAMVYMLPRVVTDLANPERMKTGLRQMVQLLHMNGVTAYNEPGALIDPASAKLYTEILGAPEVPMYSYFIAEGNTLYMAKGDSALYYAEKVKDLLPKEGKIRFFNKQIKFLLDGAIISQLMQMNGGYKDGHHGEWMIEPPALDRATKLFWDKDWQIHIHVNGDKGLDTLLAILERRMKEHPRQDHRTVIVHFANSTEAQIKRIKALGTIVSANPYYVTGFADKFSEIGLGPERAQAMARLGSLEKEGIPFSLHSDLPMGPANPLYLAWCAATRKTLNGNVARPDLAVSLHGAMRAITIEAAYSWREEERIGSIKVGKTANFTILDRNPYKGTADQLKDIKVLGTIFEGRDFPVSK